MDNIEQFYRQELALFRDRAKADPHLWQLLSGHAADSDAGYVLESFAFLTASLRAHLEAPYTELGEALLQRLMPEMLKPFPSFTALAFSMEDRSMTGPVTVEAGARCASQPVLTKGTPFTLPRQHEDRQDKGTPCHFSTCRRTALLPFTLERTDLDNSAVRSEITLHFRTHRPLTLQQLHLELLRLCLAHDPETGRMLYLWFRVHFCGGALRVNDEVIPLERIFFKSVGFEADETLLPWSPSLALGHRILLEYFLYPEGFLYIDLMNLPELPEITCEQFSLCLHFEKPLPPDIAIDQQSIQLYCTPAVNRFSWFSEVIPNQGVSRDLPLLPKNAFRSHLEIYSVDEVVSWTGELTYGSGRFYPAFEQAGLKPAGGGDGCTVYHRVEQQRELFSGHVEYALSLVHSDGEPATLTDSFLRARLTCTNLDLPLKLAVGDITVPGPGMPPLIALRNISLPTAPLPPLRNGKTLWGMLSNMALNFLSLLSRETLTETLWPYDLRSQHDPHAGRLREQKLAGIRNFETDVWDWIFDGLPVRGMESDLYLSADNGAFTSEGDLYLFGTVMSHFFAVYASIHSYHRLRVHDLDTGEQYQWRVRKGQRALI